MSAPLTIHIVGREECEGHHLDLFLERSRKKSMVLKYCDDCAVRLRDEIKRAMREAMSDEEGYAPA